jgi:hypothetical protein
MKTYGSGGTAPPMSTAALDRGERYLRYPRDCGTGGLVATTVGMDAVGYTEIYFPYREPNPGLADVGPSLY